MVKRKIEMETSVVVNGKKWDLYGVDYSTADGEFGTYIYAMSFEHAAAIIEELKETAKLSGRVTGSVAFDAPT